MGPPSAICAPAASLAAAPANFVQINPEALYPVAFGLFSHALRIARTRRFSYLSLIFARKKRGNKQRMGPGFPFLLNPRPSIDDFARSGACPSMGALSQLPPSAQG